MINGTTGGGSGHGGHGTAAWKSISLFPVTAITAAQPKAADCPALSQAGGTANNRNEEVSAITRALKRDLAKGLGVPVLALSQLNRELEKTNRRPKLSDLRDSGAIEQDADLVIFIHRPEMYKDLREKAETSGQSIEGVADIHLSKHRNGPTGTIRLHFHKAFTRFDSHTDREGG